jgi:hypothetical protein
MYKMLLFIELNELEAQNKMPDKKIILLFDTAKIYISVQFCKFEVLIRKTETIGEKKTFERFFCGF